MRELVLKRLKDILNDAGDYGLPRCFDCDESEYITDPAELDSMSDKDLLEVLESVVGFQG